MVTEKPRIKLTYEDYRSTPDDKRYELLDGELILAPAPRTTHQMVQNNISWRMSQFVAREDLGRVFNAPTDVVLSGTDIVQPDIVFVSRERVHVITENDIQGAPNLVVEVLSPSHCQSRSGVQAVSVRSAWCERVLDGGGRVGDDHGAAAWRKRVRGVRHFW